ncbi:MAG: hypothetical protein WCI77_08080 [Candidatus Omnitrophota bacterium]
MSNEISLKFGSLTFSNTIVISDIDIKDDLQVSLTAIPNSCGSVAELAKRKYLTISVEGSVSGSDVDDLRANIDTLKAALYNGLQKFTKDDDRYIYAQLKNFNKTYKSAQKLALFTATFIAHFPFWLSETEHEDDRTPTSGVGYTLNNAGNAKPRVKIEITAPAGGISDNIKIENTTNGQSFQYRGDLAVGEVLEVDNRYDTDDFEVLNDSTDDTVNFEGDFIELEPGNNTIVFTGTAGATVKITHRDCWY